MSVGDAALGWLGDYARLDGIFWRIVPVSGSEIEPNLLRFNLLQRYSYRGYADRTVQLDMESRRMGIQYLYALRELLEDGGSPGDKVKCETTRGRLLSALPPDRLVLTDELQAQLESACG
jgi:hypothetical protein